MTDCIFCTIISGDIPCHKVYEDDKVIAILDHKPVHKGHTMVIPKNHVDNFIDLDDDLASHICVIANMIGRNINKHLSPKRVGFVVAGFGVAHAHYHIIPMWGDQDITSSQYTVIKDGQITFTTDHILTPSRDEQESLAKSLAIN